MSGKAALSGLDKLRETVSILGQIPSLEVMAEQLLKVPAFRFSEGTIVDPPVAVDLQERISSFYQAANAMCTLLERNMQKADPMTISIRLPPLRSLNDLAEFVKAMEFIFDVPVRRLLGDGVRFSGFDIGTDWILLSPDTVNHAVDLAKQVTPIAAGASAVALGLNRISAFIFSFLDRFQAWRFDCLRYDVMLTQAQHYRGAVKIAEQMQQMQKEIAEQQKELAVNQLMEAHAPGAKPEEIAEARNAASIAMTELNKWIQRGTEVHPALNAPREIKELLPVPVTSVIPEPKALPAHSDNGTESSEDPSK